MPQVGPLEILIVAVIALIVFGPQKLPEIARTAGRFLNQLKSMANEVRSEFSAGLDVVDDEPVADEVTVPPEEPAAEEPASEPTAEKETDP
jgi:Tat protein translocase TatB subunit